MTDHSNQRLTGVLVIAVAISVLGSSFQYGYNIAVVNAPAKLMQSYFFDLNCTVETVETVNILSTALILNSTSQNETEGEIVGVGVEEKLSSLNCLELNGYQTFLWSFTVAIYTVGGMIGSLSTGIVVKKLGRKGALLANNALSIIGAILMGTSKVADSLEMVIVARFLLGIFAGLSTGVVPLYIGEISPKRLRGGIGVVNQLSITIGILLAQILSLKELLGTAELWPILLAFTAIPSIIQLIILPFLPESPRCLLIDNEQEEKAVEALRRFRGTNDVKGELQEMRREAAAEAASEQMSMWEIMKIRAVRWQLISIAVLQITQQLCGINAIFFYLNVIFEAAGVDADLQNYASVGVGIVNVLMTVISVVLMDRAGRKLLLAGGYGIAAFFCVLITVSLSLQDQIKWMSSLSIACVIGFIVGFAIGPGPVPWLLTAEFFRQSARPAASSIGCCVNWTFNFALAMAFTSMQKAMGAYVFLFFLAICIMAVIYIVIVVPETKHKTFQEINQLFAKRNKIKDEDIEMTDEVQHIVRH